MNTSNAAKKYEPIDWDSLPVLDTALYEPFDAEIPYLVMDEYGGSATLQIGLEDIENPDGGLFFQVADADGNTSKVLVEPSNILGIAKYLRGYHKYVGDASRYTNTIKAVTAGVVAAMGYSEKDDIPQHDAKRMERIISDAVRAVYS